MPRKTKQDQADTVIVYEASPGRAPASAHDAADELLPPEHRLSDEERAQPALTWLHQDASHGRGIRAERRRERHTRTETASPPREVTETALTGTVVTPTSIAVVVEDDEDARGLAAAIIEDSGLKVIACGNAEDALEQMCLHGSNVALLFADMDLSSGMDGEALAQIVRRNWPDTCVLVTSHRDSDAALPDHAVYMPKPWEPRICWQP